MQPLALMYFDIDHFKTINDSYGHDVGDALLRAFAERVSETVRELDLFARLGGDEFALILEGVPSLAEAEHIGAKLVNAVRRPFDVGRTHPLREHQHRHRVFRSRHGARGAHPARRPGDVHRQARGPRQVRVASAPGAAQKLHS